MDKKSNKKSSKNIVTMGDRGNYHLKNKVNDLTGKEWLKFTKSWAVINPIRRKKNTILHPAKFPEQLVESFVSFFTKENQIVFDPFLGTGSTLVASANIKRSGIGIELSKNYSNIARNRIKSINQTQFVINGDSSKISSELKEELKSSLKELNAEFVDFIFTSPPYWNMLKQSRGNIKTLKKLHVESGGDNYYSDDTADLGNLSDYEEYMELMVDIFYQCYELLIEGGYMVIVIQNIRVKEGNMVPLAWDLAIRLSKKYVLKQEKIWLQDNKKLNIWGYPSTYVSNVHHHYCLVFQKL